MASPPRTAGTLLSPASDVTAVVTACGRPDLLGATLRSLFASLDEPLAAVIVVEDSGVAGVNAELEAAYPWIDWVANARNVGQLASIDAAYARVRTPYIAHCEDDWAFSAPGPWVAASKRILAGNPKIFAVMLRGYGAPYGVGPTLPDGTVLVAETPRYPVSMSWNPGLRRLADYHEQCPRGFADAQGGGGHEHGWAELLFARGFRMAHCFAAPVAVHAGDGRHVPDVHLVGRGGGGGGGGGVANASA